jgi:tetratricopeptide (TPR) repeat protein
MKNFLAALLLAALPLSAMPLIALAQDSGKEPTLEATPDVSPAEKRAEQLDQLFGVLKSKDPEVAAQRTEDRIWSLWMKSDSPTADLLLAQGAAAMGAEEFDSSEQILNHLISTSTNYAEAHYKRAALYFRMRRFDQSLKDIDKVLELEPRHFGAISGRGLIYLEQKRRNEALASFEEALAINPHLEAIAAKVKEMKAEQPDI